MRKGIILAGGTGSRLLPLTFCITKQLLPIHDKPMIFYPLATMMDLGVKEILIVTTEYDQPLFKKLLGNGQHLGINLFYKIQKKPNGIAEGLIIGEDFLSGDSSVFILGDNLFIGSINTEIVKKAFSNKYNTTIFTYAVTDPERYGVVTLDEQNQPLDIIEKPKIKVSNNAVTGLYFFDGNAPNLAKTLVPSGRNELEITDLNKIYLKNRLLKVLKLDNQITWLDAGTINSLYEATNFVSALERRTGKKIACIEEIAFLKKYINLDQLKKIRLRYDKSDYGSYIQNIINKCL